ncbi:MAG: hypothetical protein ACRC6T_08595 [Sarcina sp.]
MNNKKIDFVTIILGILFAVLAVVAILSFSNAGKEEINSMMSMGSESQAVGAQSQNVSNQESPYYNAGSYVANQQNSENSDNGPAVNMHSVNYNSGGIQSSNNS